jgi:hypothetical protein
MAPNTKRFQLLGLMSISAYVSKRSRYTYNKAPQNALMSYFIRPVDSYGCNMGLQSHSRVHGKEHRPRRSWNRETTTMCTCVTKFYSFNNNKTKKYWVQYVLYPNISRFNMLWTAVGAKHTNRKSLTPAGATCRELKTHKAQLHLTSGVKHRIIQFYYIFYVAKSIFHLYICIFCFAIDG